MKKKRFYKNKEIYYYEYLTEHNGKMIIIITV